MRALVDIVDAAFDAGRRHDRQQLEILKTETMAAASKIASDTVEDPPDQESGYSNIKLAGMLRMDTWFNGSKPIAWMPLPEPYGKGDLRDEQT